MTEDNNAKQVEKATDGASMAAPQPAPKPVTSALQRLRWREVDPGSFAEAGYVLEEAIPCVGYVFPDGTLAPNPTDRVHWCPVQVVTKYGQPTGRALVVDRDSRVGRSVPLEHIPTVIEL